MAYRGPDQHSQAFQDPPPAQHSQRRTQTQDVYTNGSALPSTRQPGYATPVPHYQSQPAQLAQCQPHDAGFKIPPPSTVPPVQYVDPSFLQQIAPSKPSHSRHSQPPVAQPLQPATAAQNSVGVASKGPLQTITKKDARSTSSASSVSKSPAVSHAPGHGDVLSISFLLGVAEDLFSQANRVAHSVAQGMLGADVAAHHKMVSTGLRLLETALQWRHLQPRLEARVRLRYASILIDETTNMMEAETALTEGISVCAKHRLLDLAYCMQFLLLKVLFQRNPKVAFKSIDTHISNCTTFKHAHWVYVFRFLKASFYLQSGAATDHHALDNLRKIASMAEERGDLAICVMSHLLEGLAHLTTMKDDAATRIQTCLAAAGKLQLQVSAQLPQIEVMRTMLDFACSMQNKLYSVSLQKLSALQRMMAKLDTSNWSSHGELLLPVKKQANASHTISDDTRDIVRQGLTDDVLVIPTLRRQEYCAIVATFVSVVQLSTQRDAKTKSMIENGASTIVSLQNATSLPAVRNLQQALQHHGWVSELRSFFLALTGLHAATGSDWAKLKQCIRDIETIAPPAGLLDRLILYLQGVLRQGTTKLDEALDIWEDERFVLVSNHTPGTRISPLDAELAILAALNRLWIMQEPSHRDDKKAAELIDALRQQCESSADVEIRTAYHLVMATIRPQPPFSIQEVKRHIQSALNGARDIGNTYFSSIALNTMRLRLFDNVIGDQALKSARASAAQSRKSGNLLWGSVAQGMLAQSLELHGLKQEAAQAYEEGLEWANEARKMSMSSM